MLSSPVRAAQAEGIRVNPLSVLIPATLCTSFSFLLPASNPPNAVVFAYGHFSVADMVSVTNILWHFSLKKNFFLPWPPRWPVLPGEGGAGRQRDRPPRRLIGREHLGRAFVLTGYVSRLGAAAQRHRAVTGAARTPLHLFCPFVFLFFSSLLLRQYHHNGSVNPPQYCSSHWITNFFGGFFCKYS